MATNLWTRAKAYFVRIEECGDAWARRRLTAEEYAEASDLDRLIKLHFWKWFAMFVAATLVGGLIVLGISPEMSFAKAAVGSGVVILYALAAVASAWYGYRKWAKHPFWYILGIFILLMLAGTLFGFSISSFMSGRAFTDLAWERVARGASVALLLGIGASAVLLTIARLRQREALQRAARLEAEAERERLARQSIQAELKLLQAQVEPHFLFNTLANIRHLVQTGSPDAVVMLDHLIRYLRTALPEIRAEGSTLGREADLARAYLEILRIRMGGTLSFAIDIPDELAREPFPPLMVITLVENAIKHGVAPQGRGRVDIRAAKQGDRIHVTVEDDGRGLQEPIGQGIGLANVRERLRAIFGESASLALSGRDGPGTRAVIEVPA
ncbi:hypothetical protein DSM104443_04090 [Usitatibacter rugosus]|uniref:histidine kinase n=1 Tax=Usitatibacter rugosus TaxID=2732067 RepID=A0A6M4H0G5_9PROT|nr:histidine kinase [Usitatibacter rugosus]QJR12996.1 hypothetical protein DSM104443_04090 [Usitatibacter rugosus]